MSRLRILFTRLTKTSDSKRRGYRVAPSEQMDEMAEAQENTLKSFLSAWTRWSAEGQIELFTDDIKQRTLPFSLGIPARTKGEIQATLPRLEEVVTDYKLTIHHVVHDPKRRLASILATSSGKSPFTPWRQEYAVYIRFTEDGKKICQIDEMMDASFLMEFTPHFLRYLAEHPVDLKDVGAS